MKRKTVLMAPLALAIALTILITPAAALEPPTKHEFTGLGGKGIARIGMFDYVCGEAFFGYCFEWDYAVLIFDVMVCGYTGVWDIIDCTIREYGCFETFRGEWVPSTMVKDSENGANGMKLLFENDLCCGDIRVIAFLKDGVRSFVLVYGPGVFFIGYTPAPMPMPVQK
jgi:hypothetical protein